MICISALLVCVIIFIGDSLCDSNNNCATAPTCINTKYRSHDGSCNNLNHPEWGMTNSTYGRLLPPKYGDGISSFATSKSGKPLPLPRRISVLLFPDVPIEDKQFTLNEMQYGQIITHDMSLTLLVAKGPCCTGPISGNILAAGSLAQYCQPILIPKSDPYFKGEVTCINFIRTITNRDRNCSRGNQPAQQVSQVNHFLDLSIVYGNSDEVNNRIRQFQGGRLKVDKINGQEWPYHLINLTTICIPANIGGVCNYASDRRVNQNPQLTVLQIILLRQHNRLADQLLDLNPQWDDEKVYQEAKKINVGIHQYISYYEWLPTLLGKENLLAYRIIYETSGFVNDYDENFDPSVLNEHATGAFRFFHTQIAGRLDMYSEVRENYESLRISDWYHDPRILYKDDNFDGLARGLNTQMELGNDRYHDEEITEFLFRNKTTYGQDLKSIDIQRNRDHGLVSYSDARQYCHLPRANKFEDLVEIKGDNIARLKSIYESVDDIDLVVGGALEILVPGALAGPTFLCIILKQFYITRKADSFWFEREGDTGFTLEQLTEIRKMTISKLICNNGRNIRYMQPQGFYKISVSNPVLPCDTLPDVNISLWKEAN